LVRTDKTESLLRKRVLIDRTVTPHRKKGQSGTMESLLHKTVPTDKTASRHHTRESCRGMPELIREMTGWNCDRKAARWSEPAH
jgi:hypothetical protein